MNPRWLWLMASGLRSSAVMSMSGSPFLCLGWSVQPRIGCQRVVDQQFGQHIVWQSGGDGIDAFEVPVRVVRREQQHLIGTDLVDDGLNQRLVRRIIERLRRQADVLANDLGWRA